MFKLIENVLFFKWTSKKYIQLYIFGNISLVARSFFNFFPQNVKNWNVSNLAYLSFIINFTKRHQYFQRNFSNHGITHWELFNDQGEFYGILKKGYNIRRLHPIFDFIFLEQAFSRIIFIQGHRNEKYSCSTIIRNC